MSTLTLVPVTPASVSLTTPTAQGVSIQPSTAATAPLTLKTASGSTAVEFVTDQSDNQNVISLYPPLADTRNAIKFFSKPKGAAGAVRPLSIETHGSADFYDTPNQHISFYVLDSTNTAVKGLEWLWGSQWENLLKVGQNLLVKGGTITFGTNGDVDLYRNSAAGRLATGSIFEVIKPSGAVTAALRASQTGNAQAQLQVNADGAMEWGDGTNARDTILKRLGANLLGTDTGDKFVATAGLGVGNSAAATTLGTVVKKIEVFDQAGTSLGFVPVYNSIT